MNFKMGDAMIKSGKKDYEKLENTIDKASKKLSFKDAYLKYSEFR